MPLNWYSAPFTNRSGYRSRWNFPSSMRLTKQQNEITTENEKGALQNCLLVIIPSCQLYLPEKIWKHGPFLVLYLLVTFINWPISEDRYIVFLIKSDSDFQLKKGATKIIFKSELFERLRSLWRFGILNPDAVKYLGKIQLKKTFISAGNFVAKLCKGSEMRTSN